MLTSTLPPRSHAPKPAPASAPAAAWRKLLPREHGSWALAFEPVALGLLAAYSVAGLALSLAVAAAFLARRPWQLTDERPEARTALAVLLLFGACSLLIALRLAGIEIALPLLAALPAGLVFIWYDSQHAARDAVPEIAGAFAFACVPAALALCAGLPADRAWTLTALMLARAVPTVCVVRAYVRCRKGRAGRGARVIGLATSFAALIAIIALFRLGLCGIAAPIFIALLAARAVWLLGPWSPDFSAKRIGLIECALGVAGVLALGATF